MYTPSNITSEKDIHVELEEMQAFLEADYPADLPDEVQSRFDSLGAYMARSGKLRADAEYHYNSLLESSIMTALKKAVEENMSTSTVNKYIESLSRDSKYLFSWADRVNRSCTHQHEGLRSVMSTLRSERYANNYGRQ